MCIYILGVVCCWIFKRSLLLGSESGKTPVAKRRRKGSRICIQKKWSAFETKMSKNKRQCTVLVRRSVGACKVIRSEGSNLNWLRTCFCRHQPTQGCPRLKELSRTRNSWSCHHCQKRSGAVRKVLLCFSFLPTQRHTRHTRHTHGKHQPRRSATLECQRRRARVSLVGGET